MEAFVRQRNKDRNVPAVLCLGRRPIQELLLFASLALFSVGTAHAQPVLIESRTSTNTDNLPFWTYPSGIWGASGNRSRVPSTPAFTSTGSRQTTNTNGPPSFQVNVTNGFSLQPGLTYAVQVTTPTSDPQPPPDDLVVSLGCTGITNSTLPATTTAFSTAGTNRWTTLGKIVCSNSHPTFKFTYASGSISDFPWRRFYAQCLRFIPQSPTNGVRTWTGAAGPADPMWNNPTNWNGVAPNLVGDDIVLAGNAGVFSIPDGPFSINSLTFASGAGGLAIGTNFSGPLTIATTNGIVNLSTNEQIIRVVINQGSVPLMIDTGAGTLTVSNALSGTGGLRVRGTGTLCIKTTNDFTGPVTVGSGVTLRLASYAGLGSSDPNAGDVTVNGAVLLNNDTTVGAPFLAASRNLIIGPGGATLCTPISIAQSLEFDGVISNSTGNGTLLKTGSGQLTLGGDTPNTFTGLTTMNGGRLILNKLVGNAIAGDLSIPAALVQLSASEQIADDATVTVSGGTLGFLAPFSETVGRVVLDSGSITGAMATLTATNFDVRSGFVTANLAGNADLVKSTAGTVTLDGDNNYTGGTIISNGTLIINGSVGFSTVTVAGGTLAGAGIFNGPATIQSAGTLAPGSSIGQMSFYSSLTLETGSTTRLKIDASSATNDSVLVLIDLTYGGTLTVTNLSGSPAPGDSYQLFDAANYHGAFAGFTLPPLAPDLRWDTSDLVTNGTLKVVIRQAQFLSSELSGTDLIVTGTYGVINGAYQVLASTNIALPLTNWTVLVTNHFDENGDFSFTNVAVGPGRFFMLRQLP